MCKWIAVFFFGTLRIFKRKLAVPPKHNEMVKQAISTLKERGGSSSQDMMKYIVKNFSVSPDEKAGKSRLIWPSATG